MGCRPPLVAGDALLLALFSRPFPPPVAVGALFLALFCGAPSVNCTATTGLAPNHGTRSGAPRVCDALQLDMDSMPVRFPNSHGHEADVAWRHTYTVMQRESGLK